MRRLFFLPLALAPCAVLAEQPTTQWIPQPGVAATVYAPEVGVTFAAADLFAYVDLMKVADAEDSVGLEEMEGKGRVARVSHGIPCLVLEYNANHLLTHGVPAVRVRFQGGPLEGHAGWMIGDRVRPRRVR